MEVAHTKSIKAAVRKWLKRALIVGAMFCLCYVSFRLGAASVSWDEPYQAHLEKSRAALQGTHLPDSFASYFVMHGSHIGRDMYSQTVFQCDSSDRDAVMQSIRQTEGWTVDPLTADDYRDFVGVTWFPELNKLTIADHVVFDAWFYEATTPAAGYEPMLTGYFSAMGRIDRGFKFAAYDQDTGLFIYIRQFG